MPALTDQQFNNYLFLNGKPSQIRNALLAHATKRVGQQEAGDCLSAATLHVLYTGDPPGSREPILSRFNADDGPAGFLNWFRQFVDYACADLLRRRDLCREESMDPQHPCFDVVDDGDLSGLEEQRRLDLLELIERADLTERQYACITRYVDGMTVEQIAREIGCVRRQTVYEHIEAARTRIKRVCLEQRSAILECFEDSLEVYRYQAPTTTGAGLARIALRRLSEADARTNAKIRQAQRRRYR